MKNGKLSNMKNERVVLNICGERYETYRKTLARYPTTLLGNFRKREKFYRPHRKEYFFDRHRVMFEAILFFYQSDGILRCPPDIPTDTFEEECRFYELPEKSIDSMKSYIPFLLKTTEIEEYDETLKSRIWKILDDNPFDSNIAASFFTISMVCIIISFSLTCLETVPGYEIDAPFDENIYYILELIVNVWFVFEFAMRFATCPNKAEFMLDLLNIVEVIILIPYFIILLAQKHDEVVSLKFLRVIRLLRLMELLKSHDGYGARTMVFGSVMRSSVNDMSLMAVCTSIAIMFGACVIYSLESLYEHSNFNDIFDGLWWSVATVTTVGYGDIFPVTISGKLFSSFFILFGIITIAMPMMIIVTRFVMYYEANVYC